MKHIPRTGLFLLFLGCGLLVFVVFSHYAPVLDRKTDLLERIVVATILLLAAWAG